MQGNFQYHRGRITCPNCDFVLIQQNVSIHCKNEHIWQSQTKELVVIDIIYHI